MPALRVQIAQVPVEGTGYFYLENRAAGLVLDIKGGNPAAGTELQMYTKNGSKAQQFKPVAIEGKDYYYLENALAGLVLDVQGGNPAEGTKVQMWEKNGSEAQWWACPAFADDAKVSESEAPSQSRRLVVPVEGTGYFCLENALAGLVLDVKGGNAAAGTEKHMELP